MVIGLYYESVWYINSKKNFSPLKQLQTSTIQLIELLSNPFAKVVHPYLHRSDPGSEVSPIVA
jgi:hypothetical protein